MSKLTEAQQRWQEHCKHVETITRSCQVHPFRYHDTAMAEVSGNTFHPRDGSGG